jgi:hypothetical protein
MLSTSDKKWICKIAGIILYCIGDINATSMTMQVASDAAGRVEKLWKEDLDLVDEAGYKRR